MTTCNKLDTYIVQTYIINHNFFRLYITFCCLQHVTGDSHTRDVLSTVLQFDNIKPTYVQRT